MTDAPSVDAPSVDTPIAGLVGLDDPTCEDPALAGTKAATLATLRRAGFAVPPGVVVPAGVFDPADADLPAAVRAALASVPDLIGPGPWAVRSSSSAEDSEAGSFAGLVRRLPEHRRPRCRQRRDPVASGDHRS